MKRSSKLFAALAGVVLLIGGAAAQTTINGAGATFPNPLYSKWFSEYNKLKQVQINYQPIGSGGGIRQLSNQTVFFGATDEVKGITMTARMSTADNMPTPTGGPEKNGNCLSAAGILASSVRTAGTRTKMPHKP